MLGFLMADQFLLGRGHVHTDITPKKEHSVAEQPGIFLAFLCNVCQLKIDKNSSIFIDKQ